MTAHTTVLSPRPFTALLVFALLLIGLGMRAAPPATIGYQGRILDDAGEPVTGLLTLTFRLYDEAEAGTEL